MSHRIFLRDGSREVYLGSQEETPPDMIRLVESTRSVGDQHISGNRSSLWRRVSVAGEDHTYVQNDNQG